MNQQLNLADCSHDRGGNWTDNSVEFVRLLIDLGKADVNITNADGFTPLQMLCCMSHNPTIYFTENSFEQRVSIQLMVLYLTLPDNWLTCYWKKEHLSMFLYPLISIPLDIISFVSYTAM